MFEKNSFAKSISQIERKDLLSINIYKVVIMQYICIWIFLYKQKNINVVFVKQVALRVAKTGSSYVLALINSPVCSPSVR